MRFATDNDLLVYLLRRHRQQHEHHLDYYVRYPDPNRPAWSLTIDPRVRLELAQVNAAIARRIRIHHTHLSQLSKTSAYYIYPVPFVVSLDEGSTNPWHETSSPTSR